MATSPSVPEANAEVAHRQGGSVSARTSQRCIHRPMRAGDAFESGGLSQGLLQTHGATLSS